ncbi:cysteine methyltransferase [Candidatus Woesearchaeota archaeon CG_4_10_14_0_8_um_filter_47_5]|nr:MAG: cysteine methyltransferase [Candidatus Woesearchaeota archaeon CG_4_10_14_0_8_um_filter_47_5]
MNSFAKSFADRVYHVTRTIPKGRVATYKDIAHVLGCRAYRAVGKALNKNPYAPEVPCHRVVRSDGSLGGFANGSRKKKQLLEKEGISFTQGRINNFEKVHYHLQDSKTPKKTY